MKNIVLSSLILLLLSGCTAGTIFDAGATGNNVNIKSGDAVQATLLKDVQHIQVNTVKILSELRDIDKRQKETEDRLTKVDARILNAEEHFVYEAIKFKVLYPFQVKFAGDFCSKVSSNKACVEFFINYKDILKRVKKGK